MRIQKRSFSGLFLLASFMVLFALKTSAQEDDLDNLLFTAVDTWSTTKGEVTALVEQGADPNAKGNHGITPLMVAALKGNERAIPELLAAGARLEDAAEGGSTALMLAGREDEKDVVVLLLDAGAEADAANDNGWTALMYAAHNKGWKTIALFIERGLDLERKTPDGRTALLVAAEAGHASIVERLLKAGARFPALAPGGIPTLLHTAAAGDREVLSRVIEFLPDLEVRGPDGETALMVAAAAGHTEVVMELLRNGASEEATDNDGGTALARAEERDDSEMAALLGAAWEPRKPATNAVTISVECEKLGGKVQLSIEPSGDQLELAVYYPKPVSAYLASARLCAIDPANRGECGFKRFSADATFYFDVDNRRKTGQTLEQGDSEVAEGAEFGVSIVEVRTSVQREGRGLVNRQVMLVQVSRDGEILYSEDREGFQSVERDLNRLALSGPMSALGIQPGQKLRVGGKIRMCGADERVVTLR